MRCQGGEGLPIMFIVTHHSIRGGMAGAAQHMGRESSTKGASETPQT